MMASASVVGSDPSPAGTPAGYQRFTAARRGTPFRLLVTGFALTAVGLLLAACSGTSATSSSSAQAPSAGSRAAGGAGAIAAPRAATGQHGTSLASIVPGGQSIIYTASMTVRPHDVAAAASTAADLATAAGGYVASERQSTRPGRPALRQISLVLKIPVARYQATLARLGALGKQVTFSQQAADVTQRVADVGSRVTSARAAIAQLRALLARAGSVSALLSVQDQINAEESALESLLAQQRALARQTSYGTISLLLVPGKPAPVARHPRAAHGFLAGLASGWRAFAAAMTWLATALGAALPFIIVLAIAGGLGWGVRRRLVRRATRPAADPPAPTAT